LLLSLHGKLQNINPVKVDKTTIINLEKVKLPHRFKLEEAVLGAMMIDKKGWMMY
jgi:replicative DNA helicase